VLGFGARIRDPPTVTQGTTVPSLVGGSPQDADTVLVIRWGAPAADGPATVLGPGATVLGRDPDCAGCLPSVEISRKHAEIRWVGGVPMLRDLDSTNGVFLNQRRVTQAPVRPRDVIRLGDWVGVLTLAARDNPAAWTFEEIIPGYWAGPSLLAALAPARRVAGSDLPIVIEGETGAGKEGAARAIHGWSGRAGRFVGLNCAALPETLAEAELFGFRKGAFTGADRTSLGHLRTAHGGTLLLDEIADLPLAVQAKLLRAIEEREVLPLGESGPASVDVRPLAATQSPLRRAVEEKRFRGDLFARLDGFHLAIPPLRERVEEIPFLFRRLIDKHGGGARPPRLDPLLVERLCAYAWPFNVRELTLLARRLVALHPNAERLESAMWSQPAPDAGRAPPAGAAAPVDEAGRAGQDVDAETFAAALRENQGNVKQTAAALGISRGRAYRLIEQLDSLDLDVIRGQTPGRSTPGD
jgi:transcriptional regulator with PAS, ATPase and Fis domain